MSVFDDLRQRLEEEIPTLIPALDPARTRSLALVCAVSDYVTKNLKRDPTEIASLFESGEMEIARDGFEMPAFTHETLDHGLRTARRREMTRIIYRDLCRLAELEETTRDLSNLADAAIATALDVHYQRNCERFGRPIGSRSGAPQLMSVLALGKLGAQELNLSSDVDLVFFFDETGETEGGKLSNQEFFVRTARALIASLDKVDEDGFVFRVDMRLRPYGESGALILHRAAMEKYFIEQGRDWERYAFIKARACAGDMDGAKDFLAWLSPFVYRKHLDFGAIDSLREMKRLINYEVDLKGLNDDLKLGHGGIREVEFVVQACQIIWGGNDTRFQERKLLRNLELLAVEGHLPSEDADALRDAYFFLRDSEHIVQAESDRQTQALPESELSKARLAVAMSFDDYETYLAALATHREAVRTCFTSFMSSNSVEQESLVEGNLFWVSIWQNRAAPNSTKLLGTAGYKDPEGSAKHIAEFDRQIERGPVQEIGASRIDRLMPVMLSLAAKEQDPDKTLIRLLTIIEAVSRRTTYVAFLLENLDALKRMVQLCAMSPWVAERLQTLPILLYELSDRVTHDTAFDKQRLVEELRQLMQNLEPGDLEGQMDSLRQFKNSAVLKVAVFELLDLLTIMKASDALTHIAEIVLDHAFELAWSYLADRHGEPCDREGAPVGKSFAIVAYGKLGGIELGYGSDLDVVFLHDADIHGSTNGEKSIENSVFYSRLAQRIGHILTSFTRFGALYEVDMRLRPDGNKGPLVATISNLERYLEKEAWTWELQALVRARFVAGNAKLKARFDAVRHAQLSRKRDNEKLREDVVSMRQKMRTHLEKGDRKQRAESGDDILISGFELEHFDLKHGAGAIVDIEFMVQYAVLAWSCEHPELTRWTDKMRILDDLRELGLMEAEEVSVLQKAYLAYRSAVHYQWLGGEMASFKQLNQYRTEVVAIWNRHMNRADPA